MDFEVPNQEKGNPMTASTPLSAPVAENATTEIMEPEEFANRWAGYATLIPELTNAIKQLLKCLGTAYLQLRLKTHYTEIKNEC